MKKEAEAEEGMIVSNNFTPSFRFLFPFSFEQEIALYEEKMSCPWLWKLIIPEAKLCLIERLSSFLWSTLSCYRSLMEANISEP